VRQAGACHPGLEGVGAVVANGTVEEVAREATVAGGMLHRDQDGGAVKPGNLEVGVLQEAVKVSRQPAGTHRFRQRHRP